MARRRKSILDDFLDVSSSLPWYIGLLLAVCSFVVLHLIAGIEIQKPSTAGGLGSFAGKQLYISMAKFGQYFLPIPFLLGAIISGLKSQKNKLHYEKVKARSEKSALFEMNWREFEDLVSEFFGRRGYAIKQTGGDGPDGGVDIVLSKGSDKYLVQCKQWKAYKVGVQVVRELHGVMAAQGAAGGFVVTAGEFSEDAKNFAEGLNIRLVEGSLLQRMMQETPPIVQQDPQLSEKAQAHPECPLCGAAMVLRTARKGPKAGQQFWGCCQYPKCKGIKNIN